MVRRFCWVSSKAFSCVLWLLCCIPLELCPRHVSDTIHDTVRTCPNCRVKVAAHAMFPRFCCPTSARGLCVTLSIFCQQPPRFPSQDLYIYSTTPVTRRNPLSVYRHVSTLTHRTAHGAGVPRNDPAPLHHEGFRGRRTRTIPRSLNLGWPPNAPAVKRTAAPSLWFRRRVSTRR